MGNTYYIGWDVGAWHCDKNTKSQDCLWVIRSNDKDNSGIHRRLCIREQFNGNNVIEFLNNVFDNDEDRKINFGQDDEIFIAIDAVLCWPKYFIELIGNGSVENNILSKINEAINNPFLYRETERIVYRETERIVGKKHKPLSAVQGQIGSQSTKAIFFLKKYAFMKDTPGVWKCGKITVIETYPAILCDSTFTHNDENDAKLCAELAQQFASDADKDADKKELRYPESKEEIESAKQEGWIWFYKSCLSK
jgi:hypothetical protein